MLHLGARQGSGEKGAAGISVWEGHQDTAFKAAKQSRVAVLCISVECKNVKSGQVYISYQYHSLFHYLAHRYRQANPITPLLGYLNAVCTGEHIKVVLLASR